MSMQPLFSSSQIDRLLSHRTISEQHPWVTDDSTLIEGHLRGACAAIRRTTRSDSRIEWNHYGSGYASYIDAWFYGTSSEFNVKLPLGYREEHLGLVVLLSRLSPYFVFMEGEKRWDDRRGTSYLPEFEMLDRLNSEGVVSLARDVQLVLEGFGLVRAFREQLTEPLSPRHTVATNLTDRGFTQFDALFHWED